MAGFCVPLEQFGSARVCGSVGTILAPLEAPIGSPCVRQVLCVMIAPRPDHRQLPQPALARIRVGVLAGCKPLADVAPLRLRFLPE